MSVDESLVAHATRTCEPVSVGYVSVRVLQLRPTFPLVAALSRIIIRDILKHAVILQELVSCGCVEVRSGLIPVRLGPSVSGIQCGLTIHRVAVVGIAVRSCGAGAVSVIRNGPCAIEVVVVASQPHLILLVDSSYHSLTLRYVSGDVEAIRPTSNLYLFYQQVSHLRYSHAVEHVGHDYLGACYQCLDPLLLDLSN